MQDFEPQYRSFDLDRAAIDEAKRTIALSFSSELPVERWFGMEILDHSPKSVDLSRLNNGAALLLNHERANHVGVVESAKIDSKRGTALVRFGKSAKAEEIFTDVKDGIRKLVSVGYRVNKMVLEKEDDGVETYRATSWYPFEISIESIPADVTVGVGRSETVTNQILIERSFMPDPAPTPAPAPAAPAPTPNLEVMRSEWRKTENTRIEEIKAMAKRMATVIPTIGELADKAIIEGTEINEFRKLAFEATPGVVKIQNPNPELGMKQRDIENYSIRRAIACASSGKLDGLEGEMDAAARQQYKENGWQSRAQGPHGIVIPYDVLNYSKRDSLAATNTLGGNLVATNLLAGSFIELLRNRMKVASLGATYLTGLVGNVAIPSQTGGATVYWAASEAAATTESSITFGQVTLAPKSVTARLDYSALLLQQSTPAIDNLIRNDLVKVMALGIDLAALHGSGASGQPTGVAGVSGIGSVTGGTNGAAATFANIIALETAIANANADSSNMAYLTNSRQRGALKQKLKNSTGTDASYIWQPGLEYGQGMMNGYRAEVSNQVSNVLTKGTSTTVCSAIFFADWSSLLIGQWGGLEILTNPYTQAANRITEVYAYQFVDINVRHAENFAAMLDAL